jgi:hypothetical protein
MGKGSTLFLIASVMLLAFGTIGLATQDSKTPAKINKDLCLGCHGPFDKVIQADAKYKVSEEETVNPHKYVPHDGKEVPECTECHTPHAIPPKDKSEVAKPNNVEFCFSGCHHMKNFQPCKTCH